MTASITLLVMLQAIKVPAILSFVIKKALSAPVLQHSHI